MTFHEYVGALARHWIAIVVMTLLGAGVAFAYASTLPDQYRSTASVMIVPEHGENTTELVQGSNYVQSLVQSYAALATKPVVLQPVVERLALSISAYQLADSITVNAPLETTIIDISVVNRDPVLAHDIADRITRSLADAVTELSPQGADAQPAVRMAVISPARMPTAPFAPSTRLYLMLGAAAGLLLGVCYALIRRIVGGRITNTEDVSAAVDAPVLGEVIESRKGYTVARTILTNPDGRVAESFRSLTANLRFVNVDGSIRTILVTSAQPGEGKSSIATGLALATAESGRRVLLIDADLRRPTIAHLTQLEGSVGVTSVLIGEVDLDDAVQPWGHANVDVLTSGALPPNPGQLLASGQLKDIIDLAELTYDTIIIDSPPALTVSDSLWLAPHVHGVLVVSRVGKSTRRRLTECLASLRGTHANVLGVVLNGVKGRQDNHYYTDESSRTAHRHRKAPVPAPQLLAVENVSGIA